MLSQANAILQDSATSLREEIVMLANSVMELQLSLTLANDQIELLKTTVRDLEAIIAREREFNASGRKINTEYLVNIIRSFLMTKDESEHSKLVPVICSLMHFHVDESKTIINKWTIKSGGLMNWLLPATPTSGVKIKSKNESMNEKQNGNEVNSYELYKDGIGGLDIY